MIDQHSRRQLRSQPRTIIIVYDQPQVNVVRRYTRTLVHRVDPDEYQQRFDRVLLDTATLLEFIKRLNIQECMVNLILFLLFLNDFF